MPTDLLSRIVLDHYSFFTHHGRLQETLWDKYGSEEYARFMKLQEVIQEFFRNLELNCTYYGKHYPNQVVREEFVGYDDLITVAIAMGNDYSTAYKLMKRHKWTLDEVVTRLQTYRRSSRKNGQDRLDHLLRGCQRLILNLPGEVNCIFVPDPDKHALLVQVVWKDVLCRSLFSFMIWDKTRQVL